MVENKMKSLNACTYRASLKLIFKRLPESEVASKNPTYKAFLKPQTQAIILVENKMKRLDARTTYRASHKLIFKRVPESEVARKNPTYRAFLKPQTQAIMVENKKKRLDARTYRASPKFLPKRVPESEVASCSCEKNTSCSSYSVHQPSPGEVRLKRASDFAGDIPSEVYKRRALRVEPLALSDFLSKLKKSSALKDEVSCSSSACSSCGSNEVDLVKLTLSQEAESSPSR